MNRTRLVALFAAVVLTGPTLALAQRGPEGERGRPHEHVDAHFGHNARYPDRGAFVRGLPRGAFVARFGRDRFWYYGGVWYRPYGGGFIVVGAPVGVFVPVLPSLYVTIPFGGVTYYYANDTYYVPDPQQGGYDVVAPPAGIEEAQAAAGGAPPAGPYPADQPPPGEPPPSAGPPPAPGAYAGPAPADSVFVYPKNGQSPDQQAKDRYECHRWAVEQTGFDPTTAGGGVAAGDNAQKRADYRRAANACLEGRGYTVR